MKIKVGLFLKIYFITTAGLSLLAVVLISFFLYRYLYQAITQTTIIYNLKLELAVEPVDIDLFGKIKARIKDKENPPETNWSGARNPFIFGGAPQPEKPLKP